MVRPGGYEAGQRPLCLGRQPELTSPCIVTTLALEATCPAMDKKEVRREKTCP